MGYAPDYINNPTRTPYTWEVLDKESGLIVISEYEGDVKTPLASVFKRLDSQKVVATTASGEEILDNVTDFIAEKEFVFRIVPLRDGFAVFELDFAAGTKLVFEKCVTDTIGMGQFEGQRITFETVMFGRVLPDGREQVLKIWPNGEMKDFDSIAQAKAVL